MARAGSLFTGLPVFYDNHSGGIPGSLFSMK